MLRCTISVSRVLHSGGRAINHEIYLTRGTRESSKFFREDEQSRLF